MLEKLREKISSRNGWVLVVDDDADNLRMASHILAAGELRASCVRSGEEALRFLSGCEACLPDLMLLDIHMPGADGFETLARLREQPCLTELPVIFLTADEDSEAEVRGLDAGAMDFIKKPFVPKVLLTRVRHILELTRLQNDLTSQVEEKTRAVVAQQERIARQQERIARLNGQVVHALAEAIDAKDAYTKGHSLRVAAYSKELARRCGFSLERQEQIYMIGLLHDVGKIGIPDTIIGKPDRLDDREYGIVKNHPVLGEKILQGISEFPELAIGARWHHERYDGRGYPDGIAGEDIPVEARIIAVTDAYDAMASRRSYRDVLPQEVIRSELEKGKGTQFDPQFAEIMLEMMAEDTEYQMRER